MDRIFYDPYKKTAGRTAKSRPVPVFRVFRDSIKLSSSYSQSFRAKPRATDSDAVRQKHRNRDRFPRRMFSSGKRGSWVLGNFCEISAKKINENRTHVNLVADPRQQEFLRYREVCPVRRSRKTQKSTIRNDSRRFTYCDNQRQQQYHDSEYDIQGMG